MFFLKIHTARHVMRAGEKPLSQREGEDASLKIFIPYDSAKFCVTQVRWSLHVESVMTRLQVL